MIPQEQEITPGMVVRHDEGLLYQVEDVRQCTDDYEVAHELGGMAVNYTQLDDGVFPAGTKWNKDEEGFRQFFTEESGHAPHDLEAEHPIFYPFSLVLGREFHSLEYGYGTPLTEDDRELRKKISSLSGSQYPQSTGQLLGVLIDGKIRGREIPQITPHPHKGVTFNDPNKLYREWRMAGVGHTLRGLMRNLIENASRAQVQ